MATKKGGKKAAKKGGAKKGGAKKGGTKKPPKKRYLQPAGLTESLPPAHTNICGHPDLTKETTRSSSEARRFFFATTISGR